MKIRFEGLQTESQMKVNTYQVIRMNLVLLYSTWLRKIVNPWYFKVFQLQTRSNLNIEVQKKKIKKRKEKEKNASTSVGFGLWSSFLRSIIWGSDIKPAVS